MYTLKKKKKNGDFFEFFCAPNTKRTRRRTQKLLINAFLSKERLSSLASVMCFARVSFFFVFFCLFFCDITCFLISFLSFLSKQSKRWEKTTTTTTKTYGV